jgi:hypothetical protein
MNYEHIVYFSKEDGKYMLQVDRLLGNGERVLMTQFEIQPSSSRSDESILWDEFEKLCSILGKSICIDSPELRRIMGID